MCQVETDCDYPNVEQLLKIDSLSSSALKSRISEHLIVEDNDSVKYRIAFTHDTSAEVNVLLKTFFDKMHLTLTRANVTLTGFGHNMVQPCGKVELKCFDKTEMCYNLTFYVCYAINHSILGKSACFDLNLLKRVNSCSDTKLDSPFLFSNICNHYADLFTGYGLYEKEYHIVIKSNVEGVVQPPHKVPYALQPKFKKYLQTLTDNCIIADVDEPTDWVYNIVVVEKKNRQLRICLDPKPLNAVILREPTQWQHFVHCNQHQRCILAHEANTQVVIINFISYSMIMQVFFMNAFWYIICQ